MNFIDIFRTPPQQATLHRIVLMRAIALSVQLAVIGVARLWLQILLPLTALFSVMLVLAFFNGWTWWRMHAADPATDLELFVQLGVDVAALSALLYFSGGATNPFVSFYLPALAVAAAILPWRYSLILAVLSLCAYSIMTSSFVPLRLTDTDQAVNYHLAGMWANFVLSAGLITWFVGRMSSALRDRDAALAQAREQHLQNEKIIALGMQAANAAHEMSTPLSTVAIIIEETRNALEGQSSLADYHDDLLTAETQIAHCKAALDRMGMQAGAESVLTETPMMLNLWLQQFTDEWRLRNPAVRFKLSMSPDAGRITDTYALGQILQTLLDNAATAASDAGKHVGLSSSAQGHAARIQITDDGPGIAPQLLYRLGFEPVASTTGGQGIGLMLAFARARQCGATIELAERPGGGTVATLVVLLK